MHKNSLRILCISPLFPPLADPESYCGGKMVKALANAGADVAVLCESLPPGRMADSSSYWKELNPMTHCIDMPLNWRTNAREMFSEMGNGLSYRIFGRSRLVRKYVTCAEKLHREKHFDVVYSRSLPMYAHIAGYWCSRSLSLPWIANINDPWDWHLIPEIEPRHVAGWYAAVSRHWLCKTLRCANLVTYPSTPLHQFHVRLSAIEHKAKVIPHIGYAANSRDHVTSKFCIVHAGRLGCREITGRSPLELLTGLARFLQGCPSARDVTRLVLVGRKDPVIIDVAKRVGLEDVVQCAGSVSYEESLKYIASASVCVLVEGKMTNGIYFPSKLVDYIVASKPILALSPAHGVVAELAREGGIRRVDANDENAIARAISDFYQAFLDGRLGELRPSDMLIDLASPNGVTERFVRAMETVCHKSVGATCPAERVV